MNRWQVVKLTSAFLSGGFIASQVQESAQWLKPVKLRAALPSDENRPNTIMKFGFPGSNSAIKVRKNYVLCYDNRLRNASWVFEHINKELLNEKESDRESSSFTEDSTIHHFFRAINKDYYKSGYDRGHIAAASNHRSHQDWMDETFYLSNVLPQNPLFNRQAWNNLEKYVRSLCYHYDNVYICTGPLYLPQKDKYGKLLVKYEVIGDNHVAVPTHFFKVVLCERSSKLELLSYVMPNEYVDPSIPLKNFLTPIETIERASGIVMFSNIPKRNFVRINQGR